jgi:hypothetical protein
MDLSCKDMQKKETCFAPALDYIINDYVEDKLSKARHTAFSDYLGYDEELRLFARKSMMGKRALRNANRKVAAPDFREKLARRIAEEKV